MLCRHVLEGEVVSDHLHDLLYFLLRGLLEEEGVVGDHGHRGERRSRLLLRRLRIDDANYLIECIDLILGQPQVLRDLDLLERVHLGGDPVGVLLRVLRVDG